MLGDVDKSPAVLHADLLQKDIGGLNGLLAQISGVDTARDTGDGKYINL